MRRALLASLLCACSATPVERPVERNPGPPVTVAIEVVAGAPIPGTRMTLHARLVRHGPWSDPIAVEFRLPPGAVQSGGTAAAVVGGTDDGPDVEIDLGTLPAGDVVVVAASRTGGAGFHAEARYRFGRPAPVNDGPAKSGPAMHVGGHDLGPSVPMDP